MIRIEGGQSLLHYRLAEKIGEGGMGVVWRARDTTLDRDVAIKVLPQAFADHPDRLARFEREAKLLASLSHPNVAAVYGLHEAGGVRFIAMELVDGEDLAERLARGPIPVAEALAIASQIAEGLAAAHEAGVVHRDLKPANVKLTAEGKVKVLDFGLAKAFEAPADSGSVDLTRSPTVTSAGTQAGMILGTAAYMSPEQARGRPTDRRTDIWSFGAVLFEMLTVRQPFPGEVASDVMAKILEREPDWSALPARLHPGVRRLLERCLTKHPENRLRDASDVRIEIQHLLSDPHGDKRTAESTGAAAAHAPKWLRLLPWALLAATLGVVAVWPLLRPRPAAPRVVHFEILPPTGHQFREFATAPDGSAVAFVATDSETITNLWIRRLDSTESRRLSGTNDAMFPFWSPDARSVGFFSAGKLRRIDLASESIQTVADAPNGRGGSWGHDGTILFTPEGADVLYAVSASGGTPRSVTSFREDEGTHRFPHFVGATRKFTFSAHDTDSSTVLRRYLGSLDSSETLPLPEGMSETYAPPGFALLVREGTLFARRLDAGSGRLSEEAFPLANDVLDVFPRTGRSSFSVSDDGVLMYLEMRVSDSRVDAYDRTGRRQETVLPAGHYLVPVLSHDGRAVVFARRAGPRVGVWVFDRQRASASLLTEVSSIEAYASWSADDRAVFVCHEGRILRLPPRGGSGETMLDAAEQQARRSLIALRDVDESSTGSYLAFIAWDPVTDFDLWLLPLEGERTPRRLSAAPGAQGHPKVSPDGRWVAYESNESGRFEVYVRSPEATQEQWLVSTDGGTSALWSADGTELYYVSADHGIMAVSVDSSAERFTAGLPVRLFDAPRTYLTTSYGFVRKPWLVGIDGDRFLFHAPDTEVRDPSIEVVLNWEALLDR